jgi:hypothetical protein
MTDESLGSPDGSEPSALAMVPQPEHLDLASLIATLEKEDPAKVVPIGFGDPHSYRGFYEDVAFEVRTNVTVGEMLAAANSAVGETFQGWKGGDNTMRLSTPVWLVSEEGRCGESLGAVLLHLMLNRTTDCARPESGGSPTGRCADCNGVSKDWCSCPDGYSPSMTGEGK